ARPADDAQRIFLFELLCFQGAFDRARKQLDVLGTRAATPGEQLAMSAYQMLLAAEETRRQVFTENALPKFLTPPSPYVNAYVFLVKKMATASADLAQLLEEAETELPAFAGTRGGAAFSTFRDADDRVAGVLEVFHGSDYLWVPIDQIESLRIAPPKRLRELLWAQARIELVGQPAADVLIPALYPESSRHQNVLVKLGRQTEWESVNDVAVKGAGLRMFLVDDEPIALPELGEVIFARAPMGAATP